MRILQINEKDGLAVEAKWFNHLLIYDEEDLLTDFVTYDYPQCINYSFLKVESKELDHFENNPFQQISLKKFISMMELTIFLKNIFLKTY